MREDGIEMKRFWKNIGKPLLVGVVLGLCLIGLQQRLAIDPDTFWRYYAMVAVPLVVGMFLYNHFYHRRYNKKMCALLELLEAGEIDRYLTELTALEQQAKGRYLRLVFRMNRVPAYTDREQYAQAIELLESLSAEPLRGDMKTVHALNLCGCYFFTDQPERAWPLYRAWEKRFRILAAHPMYAGHFAALEVLAAIYDGEYDTAEQLLTQAEEQYTTHRLQQDYGRIRAILAQKRPCEADAVSSQTQS